MDNDEQFIIIAEDLSAPVVLAADGEFIPLEEIDADTEICVFDNEHDAVQHLDQMLDDLADDVYMNHRVEDFTGDWENVKLQG